MLYYINNETSRHGRHTHVYITSQKESESVDMIEMAYHIDVSGVNPFGVHIIPSFNFVFIIGKLLNLLQYLYPVSVCFHSFDLFEV